MSKQKYYVKLKEEFQATGVTFADMSLYLNENGSFDLKYFAHSFTKPELADIKKGAFYKRAPYGDIEETGARSGWYHVTDDDSFDDEWTNELIELVPVDDEK